MWCMLSGIQTRGCFDVTKSKESADSQLLVLGLEVHSVVPPSYDTVQPLTRLHGVPTQKTTIWNFTAVKTIDPIQSLQVLSM
jgi:hypothetical protein